MPQADVPRDHLTDYERAVCYYTLPRLNNPVSLGLIMVYTFCLLEALCVIAYGNWFGNPDFVFWGIIAFIALVAFGIFIFLLRDLINGIRTRRALAQTRGVPDAPRDSSLPDPFASHVLIKHPTNMQGKLFACTQDDSSIAYFVDSTPDQDWWKITDAYDQEICRVKAVGRIGSFIFNVGLPSTLEVYVGEKLKSTIFPRYSLTSATIVIQREHSNPAKYTIRDRGIYTNGLLVGRVYLLRKSLYLDIHQDHLNESTLAYFVTLD